MKSTTSSDHLVVYIHSYNAKMVRGEADTKVKVRIRLYLISNPGMTPPELTLDFYLFIYSEHGKGAQAPATIDKIKISCLVPSPETK